MFELKPLHRDAIPAALEKALRYRLLNEPGEAESICHDVLSIDPDNQQAIITLLLALTDRFSKGYGVSGAQVKEVLSRIRAPYERAYYGGIIAERRAKALLAPGGSSQAAYGYLRDAMTCFEEAESMRPPENDDALLRWNACARMIMRNKLTPPVADELHVQSE